MSSKFEKELRESINCNSKENGSNTPDFILAQYLLGCLENFDNAVNVREEWYGRSSKEEITNTNAHIGAFYGVLIHLNDTDIKNIQDNVNSVEADAKSEIVVKHNDQSKAFTCEEFLTKLGFTMK